MSERDTIYQSVNLFTQNEVTIVCGGGGGEKLSPACPSKFKLGGSSNRSRDARRALNASKMSVGAELNVPRRWFLPKRVSPVFVCFASLMLYWCS